MWFYLRIARKYIHSFWQIICFCYIYAWEGASWKFHTIRVNKWRMRKHMFLCDLFTAFQSCTMWLIRHSARQTCLYEFVRYLRFAPCMQHLSVPYVRETFIGYTELAKNPVQALHHHTKLVYVYIVVIADHTLVNISLSGWCTTTDPSQVHFNSLFYSGKYLYAIADRTYGNFQRSNTFIILSLL